MSKAFTVITRTSGRPIFFNRCRHSVFGQDGVALRHLVISDDPADTYTEKSMHLLNVPRREGRGHNLYFNAARHEIYKAYPWLIFLDDDDHFLTPTALATIAKAITSEDDLILWQVQFPHGRRVPGAAIGLPPQPGNISGIGFCYHLKHWVDWVGESYADYRVIAELYQRLNPVWIYETLTGLQGEPGLGMRQDLPAIVESIK